MIADRAGSLPAVEQLRPGVWSIPVPIPVRSLGHVFVYAFETNRGPYLVDVGWNTDESFVALSLGLEVLGAKLSDVRGMLITHMHIDHLGLARRVRDVSDAWIAMHPAEAALLDDRFGSAPSLLAYLEAELRAMGAPEVEVAGLLDASIRLRDFEDFAHPDVLLDDGDRPDIAGWDLRAIWTPGHSPGHLCFYEPRHRVMLTGDHVLPHITPSVQFHTHAGTNPLGDYLRALEHLGEFDTAEVWPGHKYRFTDLKGRLAELSDRHGARSRRILVALASQPLTAWQVAERIRWSRPWAEFSPTARRLAVAATMANLRSLVVQGAVRELASEPSVFEILPPKDGEAT